MGEAAFGGRKQRVRGLESISLDEFAACLRSVLDHRALFGGRTAQAALPADWVAADHHAVGLQSRFVELSTPQSSGTIMLPPDSRDASLGLQHAIGKAAGPLHAGREAAASRV